jgi:hypothetical protein
MLHVPQLRAIPAFRLKFARRAKKLRQGVHILSLPFGPSLA